uniref:Uncharacterized protein n=1 Tax=Triticum urartu TaxID=4572 RepID=A0A8R7TFM7_TRIUA
MWFSEPVRCASTNHRPPLHHFPQGHITRASSASLWWTQAVLARSIDRPLNHHGLHRALHRLQPHPALPDPRERAVQARQGPGLRPGARPEEHHLHGRQHLRGPRAGHEQEGADEPAPAGRHLAPHLRHARPLRLLPRPGRLREQRRRRRRQGQARQRHPRRGLAQDARPQRPHARPGAQG